MRKKEAIEIELIKSIATHLPGTRLIRSNARAIE
jgi:hypothetical protein